MQNKYHNNNQIKSNNSGLQLYSCDSRVDHVVSLWNGLTSLRTQFINMVQIMRKLIEAERLGNWYLHLQAVSKKATIIGRLLCQVYQNLLKCHA